ncbi:MAG: hypothetical protein ACOCRX_08925 [Candidatus Woesearchaeota archaeon]
MVQIIEKAKKSDSSELEFLILYSGNFEGMKNMIFHKYNNTGIKTLFFERIPSKKEKEVYKIYKKVEEKI